jgi:deoxyribodipyrimidine photolyase-related protein
VKNIILIFGDQLSLNISSLRGIDQKRDLILIIESLKEFSRPRHHKQKIALILSAMRHFADLLRQKGLNVEYLHIDDQNNNGIFSEELYKAVKLHQVEQLILTEPSEFRMWEMTQRWKADLKIPIEIREDGRFIYSKTDFATWARDRKTLRMEHFYHQMRRLTGYLMEGDKPEGGSWNYDAQNRKIALNGIARPEQLSFNPDQITTNVITLVEKFF